MNREETESPYYSVPHQYVQQNPVIQQEITPYPFINYNRAKQWVWFVAAISGILGCYGLVKKLINLTFMDKPGGGWGWDVIQLGDLIEVVMFSIEISIGVCLFIALNNKDPKSMLVYCNAWLYGTYVLNTFTGLLIVAVLMYTGTIYPLLNAPVITYIVYRVIAFIIVKTFIGDLRKFLDQKEVVAQSHRTLMATNPEFFSQFMERTAHQGHTAYQDHTQPSPERPLVSEGTAGLDAWVVTVLLT